MNQVNNDSGEKSSTSIYEGDMTGSADASDTRRDIEPMASFYAEHPGKGSCYLYRNQSNFV